MSDPNDPTRRIPSQDPAPDQDQTPAQTPIDPGADAPRRPDAPLVNGGFIAREEVDARRAAPAADDVVYRETYSEPLPAADPAYRDPVYTEVRPRDGVEPAVWYAIAGVSLLLIVVLFLAFNRGDDDDVELVQEPPPVLVTPTPTPTDDVDVVVVDPPEPTPEPTIIVTATPTVIEAEPDEVEVTVQPAPAPPAPAPAPAPAPPAPAPAPAPPPPAPAPSTDSTGRTADDPGLAQTDDGRELFPIVQQDLPSYEGTEVNGTEVLVQEVVPQVGFWIGTTEENRIFVRDDGAATLAAGDRLNLLGAIEAIEDGAAVPDGQGGQQYRAQSVEIIPTNVERVA